MSLEELLARMSSTERCAIMVMSVERREGSQQLQHISESLCSRPGAIDVPLSKFGRLQVSEVIAR
jgi:hypothetical protein